MVIGGTIPVGAGLSPHVRTLHCQIETSYYFNFRLLKVFQKIIGSLNASEI